MQSGADRDDAQYAKKLPGRGGHRIKKEERLGNNTGIRLRLKGGAIVNVFDNATIPAREELRGR